MSHTWNDGTKDQYIGALETVLREVMGIVETITRGTTHWVGCEKAHPACKTMKAAKAVLRR